ncbi:hypothetical protein PAGU2638_28500 [Lysobacter sp. PAGU 2638]
MGCWAVDSFGNDTAADWLAEFLERKNFGLVREAIGEVVAAEGYMDAPYGTEGLAAIEVLAAALGRPTASAQAQEELMAWVSAAKPAVDPDLVQWALKALDRISGTESELRDLWEETEDFAEWQEDVASLRSRLQA